MYNTRETRLCAYSRISENLTNFQKFVKTSKKCVFSSFRGKHGPDRVFRENRVSRLENGFLGTCPGTRFFHFFRVFGVPRVPQKPVMYMPGKHEIRVPEFRVFHTPKLKISGFPGYPGNPKFQCFLGCPGTPNSGFLGTQETQEFGVSWVPGQVPRKPGIPGFLAIPGVYPRNGPKPGFPGPYGQETLFPGHSWPIWPGMARNRVPGPGIGSRDPGIGSRTPGLGGYTPQTWVRTRKKGSNGSLMTVPLGARFRGVGRVPPRNGSRDPIPGVPGPDSGVPRPRNPGFRVPDPESWVSWPYGPGNPGFGPFLGYTPGMARKPGIPGFLGTWPGTQETPNSWVSWVPRNPKFGSPGTRNFVFPGHFFAPEIGVKKTHFFDHFFDPIWGQKSGPHILGFQGTLCTPKSRKYEKPGFRANARKPGFLTKTGFSGNSRKTPFSHIYRKHRFPGNRCLYTHICTLGVYMKHTTFQDF